MSESHLTRYTLLEKALNLNDEEAWAELHTLYRRFIYYILQEMGVQENDLDDLSQSVLMALTSELKKYDRSKGKFRNWLRQVVRTKVLMYFRKSTSDQARENRYYQERIATKETNDIEQFIEKEWQLYVSNIALERVKKSYSGHAVTVFELDLEGKSTAEIEALTGIQESTIYTLRQRVKKNLLIEIRNMVAQIEGES